MTNTRRAAPRGGIVLTLLILWLVLYFAARFVLEANPGFTSGVRLTIAFAPTPFFALFLSSFIRSGSPNAPSNSSLQDWSYNHVWPMLAFFYVAGIVIAKRRYDA